ncbi:AAA family ATPase [Shewanella sp. Isolate13]|uniref:AAA family ATPase n=1 Tax=Shewanella sp. Isolate13 TaxID=2908531 RepID=UPI001EFC511D|nr:AAA family ATPase [Shewanella sp. Isolate13]MCG9730760.1 AAA family ATPase [Shewanella sp. Isolate13]
MKRVVIFGNSGSGKSTLARQLAEAYGLAHLDLDLIAWLPQTPPERTPLQQASLEIARFIDNNNAWVIEGCYSDLLKMVMSKASEIIFLNLPIDACVTNARNRPWEPHKYASKAEQDNNLSMLVDWIMQYESRRDTFSLAAHQALFDEFDGKKTMLCSNESR